MVFQAVPHLLRLSPENGHAMPNPHSQYHRQRNDPQHIITQCLQPFPVNQRVSRPQHPAASALPSSHFQKSTTRIKGMLFRRESPQDIDKRTDRAPAGNHRALMPDQWNASIFLRSHRNIPRTQRPIFHSMCLSKFL